MAEYLASIFGTEKDKVNCSFYFKIGACRHGEQCSRLHNKPSFGQTILLQNLYIAPQNTAQSADGSHSEFLVVNSVGYYIIMGYPMIVTCGRIKFHGRQEVLN
ncbi:splicing factor U2AF 35 kDa subunit [Paragonimus westermani]|uniref:Splicing factor U2AF 35 kDa subunit n=1 Tax=Paragonimus westermani TaxID=34504 RepID=A0A5J4NQM7_9TREM|nr:splicing factor U2AF 35 kDa subunit [Paragonimus westermani]